MIAADTVTHTNAKIIAALVASAALPTSGVFTRSVCASERRDAVKMIVATPLLLLLRDMR